MTEFLTSNQLRSDERILHLLSPCVEIERIYFLPGHIFVATHFLIFSRRWNLRECPDS